jgi:hypothetical protein
MGPRWGDHAVGSRAMGNTRSVGERRLAARHEVFANLLPRHLLMLRLTPA